MFTNDNGESLRLSCKVDPENTLTDFYIDQTTILNFLDDLTPKKSKTPDNLSCYVLKMIGPSILDFLELFFNLTLKSGKIPWQWKTALVTPVYKKGSRNKVLNYRPISLTSAVCRLFERIFGSKILHHLCSKKLLSPNQHGFLPKRSTITQLLDATDEWVKNYVEKKTTSVIYTDLTKAFDKVSHRKLIQIIRSNGVDGNVAKWIENFLDDRSQSVLINDSISDKLKVLSGVPQGSVIGPLVFLMYVDGSAFVCSPETKIYLFADDTKLSSTNAIDLQTSVDNVHKFLKSRQLSLATQKCQKITFSKTNLNHDFQIDNHSLKDAVTVKDLGIIISKDLRWRPHINMIKYKAFQRIHHVLKSFQTKNIWTLMKAYKSYIRPIAEYGSPIWSPYLIQDIEAVERIQRYFTKKACSRANVVFNSYKDRLYKLNLRSLQYRRCESDLIMTYKIVHNLVDLPIARFFSFQNSPYNTRSHSYSFKLKHVRSNFEMNSFANRIITTWNRLPPEVVHCNNLSRFICKLKAFDLHTVADFLF